MNINTSVSAQYTTDHILWRGTFFSFPPFGPSKEGRGAGVSSFFMLSFVNILFRLRLLYALLGFPRAIYVKYYLMVGGDVLQWLFAGLLLCVTRKLYLPLLLGALHVIQSYDITSGGLITQLHEAGIFGTWRQASRFATTSVYTLIGLHFIAPQLPF